MEKLKSRNFKIKIIIMIVIVTLFNFIIPNYSNADFGGTLAGPFIDLFAALGDAVLATLQFFMYDGGFPGISSWSILDGFNLFTISNENLLLEPTLKQYDLDANAGEEDITINADDFDRGWRSIITLGIWEKAYQIPVIRYGPEAIFSNDVPALDINY